MRASTVGTSSSCSRRVSVCCWSMSMFDDDDDVEGDAVAMFMFVVLILFLTVVTLDSSDGLGDFSCPEVELERLVSSVGRDSSYYCR